jgi:hypothetical protein
MSKAIEIKLDGPKLTPEKFIKAIQSFFALVEGVSRNVAGGKSETEWKVEVASGSAIVRATSDTPNADKTITAVTRGVHSLKSGVQSTPPWFTKDEVRAARALAEIADGTAVKSVQIKNGEAPEELSETVVKTADAILLSERSIAYGSIEGKLDTVSTRDGFKCSVLEPNYHRPVTCSFSKRELEKEAYNAFDKRVLISGMIRYGKEGYPTSIDADVLRVFPDESELPTLEEIQAIYKEIYHQP